MVIVSSSWVQFNRLPKFQLIFVDKVVPSLTLYVESVVGFREGTDLNIRSCHPR